VRYAALLGKDGTGDGSVQEETVISLLSDYWKEKIEGLPKP
jgi:hypothetical protein